MFERECACRCVCVFMTERVAMYVCVRGTKKEREKCVYICEKEAVSERERQCV